MFPADVADFAEQYDLKLTISFGERERIVKTKCLKTNELE